MKFISSLKNNFLIVGGGFGQLPGIHAARQQGFNVITVDRNPDAMGMSLSDIAIPIDIIDSEAVVSIAKQYNVCGVMTMQSDIAVPTVGAVVDALGLFGTGRVVAERCSNKILTRRAFQEAGVPQPRFAVVDNPEDAIYRAVGIGYPCVIKALIALVVVVLLEWMPKRIFRRLLKKQSDIPEAHKFL